MCHYRWHGFSHKIGCVTRATLSRASIHAIQRYGKYFVGATRAAAARSQFIVGHPPRTYRDYAADAVARWRQRVAA